MYWAKIIFKNRKKPYVSETLAKSLSLPCFTSADRISMLKFAKLIPERGHNNLQSQKFAAG